MIKTISHKKRKTTRGRQAATLQISVQQEQKKWPSQGLLEVRQKAVEGTLKFAHGIKKRIVGLNNGSRKCKELEPSERKLLAAHIVTVIQMYSKPTRGCTLRKLTISEGRVLSEYTGTHLVAVVSSHKQI